MDDNKKESVNNTPAPSPEKSEGGEAGRQETHRSQVKLPRHVFSISTFSRGATEDRSKLRIFKVSSAILFLVMFLFFLFGSFKKWREFQETQAYLEMIEKNLKGVDAMLASETGYAKCKLADEGLRYVEEALPKDPSGKDKWMKIREKYVEIVNTESKPESGSDFIVPNVLIDMAFIPKGVFLMGRLDDEHGDAAELPRRKVAIAKDFWVGRNEITNAQFRVFFPHHASKRWRRLVLDAPSQPACDVDWHQADRYCSLRTDLERTARRLPPGYVYRLPTEAEWEYACRAGTETAYYWGDSFGTIGTEFANSLDKRAADFSGIQYGGEEKAMPPTDAYLVSAPVGRFKPNAFALFDMSGNVSEWCYDWYSPNAYSQLPARSPVQLDPVVVSVEKMGEYDRSYTIQSPCKVIRGGSWGNLPSQLKSAHRDYVEPQQRYHGIGFRIVLAPVIKAAK